MNKVCIPPPQWSFSSESCLPYHNTIFQFNKCITCSAEPSKQITNSVDRKRPHHLEESQRTASDLVFAYQCRYKRKIISFFLSLIIVYRYTVIAWQAWSQSQHIQKCLLELKVNSVFWLNLYFRYVVSELLNNEGFSLFGFVHLNRCCFFFFLFVK